MTLLYRNRRLSIFIRPAFAAAAAVFLTIGSLPASNVQSASPPDENDTTYYPPSPNSLSSRLRWWRPDSVAAQASDSGLRENLPARGAPLALKTGKPADSVVTPTTASDLQSAAPLWLGCYGEGVQLFHEDNTLQGFVDVKLGRRIYNPVPTDIYFKIQGSRDLGGVAWNNRADVGIGFSVEPIHGDFLSCFAEGLAGGYIPGQRPSVEYLQTVNSLENISGGGSRAIDSLQTIQDSLEALTDQSLYGPAGGVTEIKAGALISKGWGDDVGSPPSKHFGYPLSSWGYVYSELIYSHLHYTFSVPHVSGMIVRFDDSAVTLDNLVWYVNPRAGIVLVNGVAGSFSASAAAYAWIDARHDWWNNKIWGGPLLRYRPFTALDFVLETGYMIGGYDGISNAADGLNPYSKVVSTWQFGVYFDYRLGI